MININLLPKSHKEHIKAKRFNLYLTSVTTMVLFLTGILIIGLFFIKLTLSNRMKNLDQQIGEKNQQLNEFNEAKTTIEEFNQTITIAKQLISKETNWKNILNELENAVPEKVRLTKIQPGDAQNSNESNITNFNPTNKFSIGGIAADQRSVIKLVEKLEDSDYFSDVTLISSENSSTSTTETTLAYSFQISVTINEQGKDNETSN